jgi:hypothetical protein
MGQLGSNRAALLGLKQKVLRSYSQAGENACSFTDLRMTNFGMGEINLQTEPHYHAKTHLTLANKMR